MKEKDYFLTLHLRGYPEFAVLKAVSDGFRSEIIFTIQLYKRTEGLFGFVAEELLREDNLVSIAGWDRFQQEYFIDMPDGGQVSVSTSGLFSQLLSQVINYPLHIPAPQQNVQYMLKIRAKVVPIKLVSPLNLLTFFSGEYQLKTPWRNFELSREVP